MEIRFLGAHNSESADTKMVSLLIDGVLALDAGGLTSSLSIAEQEKIEAVLLTHRHYDHIKDLPPLGMNRYRTGPVGIYALASTLDTIANYLMKEELYIDFTRKPAPEKPVFKLHPLEPYQVVTIAGYTVVAVPVNHPAPTVGYQVTSPDGKAVFYSGDSGQGLSSCWEHVSPDLIITEVTVPNSYEETAVKSGHLTPGLLRQELIEFRKARDYLPPVVLVHMTPQAEESIKDEVGKVARELGTVITLGYEGMRVEV